MNGMKVLKKIFYTNKGGCCRREKSLSPVVDDDEGLWSFSNFPKHKLETSFLQSKIKGVERETKERQKREAKERQKKD